MGIMDAAQQIQERHVIPHKHGKDAGIILVDQTLLVQPLKLLPDVDIDRIVQLPLRN